MNLSQSILITGASSGLGLALAQRLAAPGVTLLLGGRDPARLEAVSAVCRSQGADARPRLIDVRDRAAMEDWITGSGRLDLVIANAGISAGTHGGAPEGPDQVRAIFATNLDGALNTMLPALAHMAAQDPGPDGLRGKIACVASIAGHIALPHAPSYCAAKAAADRWTVATAPQARTLGVRMVSVCPGYVRTPMTAINRFPMPGLMDAGQAATLILHAIDGSRDRVAFPAWFALFVRLAGLLPPRWIELATSKSPGKSPH